MLDAAAVPESARDVLRPEGEMAGRVSKPKVVPQTVSTGVLLVSVVLAITLVAVVLSLF